ncbi:glycosyltransferase [Hwanghaeella grinnelliae]|uniref:Glycosyltransferase n=1 Tax=Hwanghaeella grinnelliae TaxID=2500179 RepID=A0A437QHT0_9PROT|nr:glycosyltransferase family 2 protein [Hwanghaeella grinnelliae]RVU34112.1 glycosyltransferase [Hwanghaeella grinnelliae]
MKTISIVVPMYNEAEVLPKMYSELTATINALDYGFEIVLVNDGSRDDTVQEALKLVEKDERVLLVDLSRNFGKEIALTAGLDKASGDAVIPMDADLQDPPTLIPDLVKKWEEGYQVVNAKRISRDADSFMKRTSAAIFYRLFRKLSGKTEIPENVGDFRLLDRQALDSLLSMREHHRFMKGLFAYVGYRQATVEYERPIRAAGETKFNYWKLWNFSLEGITSFSIAPLKVSTYLGVASAAFAFLYGIYIFVRTVLIGEDVPGFPTIVVLVTFLGGVQLFFLGVFGEYMGRMFNEVKNRPLYFVAREYRQTKNDNGDKE